MSLVSILNYAQQLIQSCVQAGEPVIDATVGNGIDTIFLRKTVGMNGHVFGFDIQKQALDTAHESLMKEFGSLENIHLFHQNHSDMVSSIPAAFHGKIAAVTFNTGYLPGGDHSIITIPETTIPALDASLYLLRKGGIITLVLYSGHEGALEEVDSILTWVGRLSQKDYQVIRYQFINQKHHPPFLVAIEKR